MSPETKARWIKRAEIKADLIDKRRTISGRDLNLLAGLPADAIWREENFA